uniref:Uncharacterized protein n=1 Tax=Anopheles coluzzii TaxID=1518534 RepID=A0A8W7PYD8_ANOCL
MATHNRAPQDEIRVPVRGPHFNNKPISIMTATMHGRLHPYASTCILASLKSSSPPAAFGPNLAENAMVRSQSRKLPTAPTGALKLSSPNLPQHFRHGTEAARVKMLRPGSNPPAVGFTERPCAYANIQRQLPKKSFFSTTGRATGGNSLKFVSAKQRTSPI